MPNYVLEVASNVAALQAMLLEVTSSGLTHSCGSSAFGHAICAAVMWAFPRHRLTHMESDGRGSYTDLNFGTIEFDWPSEDEDQLQMEDVLAAGASTRSASMMVKIHGKDGKVRKATKMEGDDMHVLSMAEGAVARTPMNEEMAI